jgi:hypothetical protein
MAGEVEVPAMRVEGGTGSADEPFPLAEGLAADWTEFSAKSFEVLGVVVDDEEGFSVEATKDIPGDWVSSFVFGEPLDPEWDLFEFEWSCRSCWHSRLFFIEKFSS